MDKKQNDFAHRNVIVGQTSSEDEILWQSFKRGNEKAFEQLYSRFVRIIYNYAKIYSSDKPFIEDCIQDVFIDLWRRREFLGHVISIRFYLYNAIKRKIRLEQAKLKRQDQKISKVIEDEVELSQEDALIFNEEAEIRQSILESHLSLLTQDQREVIYLKYFKEMSPREISIVMSEKLDNVYKLLSRGIETLRKNMNNNSLLFLLLVFLFLFFKN